MTAFGVLQIALFFVLILICAKPLGAYMARVFEGQRTFLHPMLRWLEVLTYKVSGIQEDVEQRWTQYAAALLSFSIFGFLLTYLLQRAQAFLPFNPQHFGASNVPPDLAFNTATSFVTNTNWQAYGGESTLSYFVQMAALTVQNFASAAAGIAIAVALIRGFARTERRTIGNFWVDVTRATVYVLLPIAVVAALLYVSQGAVQNLSPYTQVTTVEGAKQTIAQGPVASQEAIKQLGTNGGGFFNANSAHPFENPTPASNLLAMFLIFLIPGALTYTFGKMVGDTRQGWAIFAAFSVMFLIGVFVCYQFEQAGNPNLSKIGIESMASAGQPGGNMEGKEVRFGIANSALFATVTTDASCGAVNSMHASYTPIGALVPLFNMQTGEVIFGGVGAGLYGILLYCILAVFIAGLMVGRTPEYLGKKIEQKEVKMAMLAVIATAFSILVFTALSSVIHFPEKGYWNAPGAATANIANSGPRGFAEILYAYSSGTANNGSAFAGLTANTPWYDLTIGLAMWIGRFLFLLPLLAAAGSLVAKKKIPATSGTLPTHGPLFVGLLIGTVIIVGALTFFPALSLGPIVEHYLMHGGRLFSMIMPGIWS
jgi:K+-transporting ATPase ATPase A chain